MGLSATANSVAQQHFPSYPPQRAYGPLSGKACCATANCVAPAPPSKMVTILRHCRCADCLNFSSINDEYFCSFYIGGTAVVWATGEHYCVPLPNAWHYCARYRGPQVSKDVWVWPKGGAGVIERPALGGGGPSNGPLWPEPVGEDRSNRHHHTTPPRPGSSIPNAPDTRTSHQVCAGSTIAQEVEQSDEDAPVRQRGVDHQTGQGGQDRIPTKVTPVVTLVGHAVGTPPASVLEDRDGNSRGRSFCLLRIANTTRQQAGIP